jgi:hypothetical protein
MVTPVLGFAPTPGRLRGRGHVDAEAEALAC